jgi:hypothetical protein
LSENIADNGVRAQLRMTQVEHLDQARTMSFEGDGSFNVRKKLIGAWRGSGGEGRCAAGGRLPWRLSPSIFNFA